MYFVYDVYKNSIHKNTIVVNALDEKHAENFLHKTLTGFSFKLIRTSVSIVNADGKNDPS